MSQQSYNFSMPLREWFQITVSEASLVRPAPNSTQQPNGQIYVYPGNSAPPESPSNTAAAVTPSSGYGILSLTAPGPYWLYYDSASGNALQMVLEPLEGRQPPSSDDGLDGFFYRKNAAGSGSGVSIAAGASQQIFTPNPRRKRLTLCCDDYTGTGVIHVRYDNSAPTTTNADDIFDFTLIRTYTMTGKDCPKGGVYAYYFSGAGTLNLLGSQWE